MKSDWITVNWVQVCHTPRIHGKYLHTDDPHEASKDADKVEKECDETKLHQIP